MPLEVRRAVAEAMTGEEPPRVYVAVEGDALVGFCAVGRGEDAEEGVAEIGAMYVDPDVWRTGVGRALMDVALEGLRADGWRSVKLWVLAENRPAREFYARYAFEADGAEMTHEGSDAKEVRLRASITR